MKRIGLYSFLLGLSSLTFAQDDKTDLKIVKDGVVLLEGKLLKIDKEGSISPLTADVDFGNGTKISKTGEISSGGHKSKLHEGEVLLRNGNFAILQSHTRQLTGFVKKDGKMLEIQPSSLVPISEDKTIGENKLSSDGKYYVGTSGNFIQLEDNEIVTSSGEIFLATEEPTQESYVIKRDNVVIKAVNNKLGIIDADYLFPNGMKVSPQGIVTTKEGLTFSLRNEEKLNSKGELYLNNEHLFLNGLVKKDGLVYLVKDGRVSQLNDDYATPDSVKVSTKGIISRGATHEKFVMREGDVVSFEGKLMVAAAGCSDAAKGKKERFILDHILFKDNKLFIIKDAETSLLTKEIVLTDGSKILKTGHILKANGSKIQLHDGQRIALTGEDLPDEKPEETSNPDKNYLTMLRGRVWLVTDGKPALLKEEYNIHNKMIVKTDGFVQKSDGSKFMMKENDRLSLDGVVIALDKRPLTGQLPHEYYILKIGKMWMVTDGKPTKLEKEVHTPEGTKILLDGTVVKKDKQKFILKEGEKIDSRGEILTGK